MGFFKKIGKGLKGITKAISLKNVKKVATGNFVDVGAEIAGRAKKGLIDEFTKKSQKPAQNLNMQNDAIDISMMVKQNPNIKEILTGALGGALQGAGETLSGSQTVAEIGANTADNVAMAWIKKHWLKLLGGIAVAGLFIWGLIKMLSPKKKKYGR